MAWLCRCDVWHSDIKRKCKNCARWKRDARADRVLEMLAAETRPTIGSMTKKRGYSDEFPTTREKRVYFMLDKIPPALWIRVKAKAKREGVSLRSLILGWCQEWIDERKA
jgi:hypothetical protein